MEKSFKKVRGKERLRNPCKETPIKQTDADTKTKNEIKILKPDSKANMRIEYCQNTDSKLLKSTKTFPLKNSSNVQVGTANPQAASYTFKESHREINQNQPGKQFGNVIKSALSRNVTKSAPSGNVIKSAPSGNVTKSAQSGNVTKSAPPKKYMGTDEQKLPSSYIYKGKKFNSDEINVIEANRRYHRTKNLGGNNSNFKRFPDSGNSNSKCLPAASYSKYVQNGDNFQPKINNESNVSNELGWTTVNRKKNFKLESDTNEDNPLVNNDSEEMKKLQLLRKLRRKEKKKFKREEKAIQLRETLRKDTKVSIISQDMIDNMSKLALKNDKGNISFGNQSFKSNYAEDYPSLSNNFRLNQTIPKKGNVPAASNPKNKFMPIYKCEKNSPVSYSSVAFSQGKSLELDHFSNPVLAVNESLESPSKKKVKSKDPLTLDIVELLEMKQKELEKKSKTSKLQSELRKSEKENVPEKHTGKIREGKAKKLSTLKKNILREKQREKENFLAILSGIGHENNTTPCLERVPPVSENKLPTQAVAAAGVNCIPEDIVTVSSNHDGPIKVLHNNENPVVTSANQIGPMERNQVPVNILDLQKELLIMLNPIHNSKFREYCQHVTTPEINNVLKELVELLVKFQDRQYQQDPMKAKAKRRYYCGLKEALKHMNRLSCIIMAPNLKPSPGTGCIDELVGKIINRASESNVPVIFGLTKRDLGYLCKRKVPVSCFAIVNYQGAQEKFDRLMELVPEAKEQYELLTARNAAKVVDEVTVPVKSEAGHNDKPQINVTDTLLEALKKD